MVERAAHARPGRPARRGHRRVGPGQPAALRAGRGFVERAIADGARPSSAAAPTRSSAGCTSPRRSWSDAEPGQRDPHRGGLRSGADRADLRRRGAGAWRWPTTPGSGWRPPWSPATPSGPSGSVARLNAGTVWVNCFFVRDLGAPVRRQRQVRHRPRGRHLVLRLLQRHQEHRVRPDRLDHRTPRGRTPMGEVVGAGLLAHVPTIVLPEETRRELNSGEDITPGRRRSSSCAGGLRDPRLRHRRGPGLALGDDRGVRGHRAGASRRAVHLRGAARAGCASGPYDFPRRPRAGAR